jgi:quercetin dioxygenase-like cupin family protein
MSFPAFFGHFPHLALPYPDEVVTTHAIRSARGLVVFFAFHKTSDIPEHVHRGQWGMVVEGEITLTIGGTSTTYRTGENYYVPAGTPHAVHVTAGTRAIDVFEEPDRYPLRGG